VPRDDVEIGYPEKFEMLLRTWEAGIVHRLGVYSSELLWPDDALFSLLSRDQGGNTVLLRLIASPAHRARWRDMLTSITEVLVGSGMGWTETVPLWLKEFARQVPGGSASLNVFNPSNILQALRRFAEDGDTLAFPVFEIVTSQGEPSSLVTALLGFLVWDGTTYPADPVVSAKPCRKSTSLERRKDWTKRRCMSPRKMLLRLGFRTETLVTLTSSTSSKRVPSMRATFSTWVFATVSD
jgi:hypothetical protein